MTCCFYIYTSLCKLHYWCITRTLEGSSKTVVRTGSLELEKPELKSHLHQSWDHTSYLISEPLSPPIKWEFKNSPYKVFMRDKCINECQVISFEWNHGKNWKRLATIVILLYTWGKPCLWSISHSDLTVTQ